MQLKNEFSFQKKSKIKAGEGKNAGIYPFFTSSDTKALYIDNYMFDEEAVILGTGGKPSCNYYKGKFAVSTDNFVLTSNGKIEAKVLYYFLRNNNLSILSQGFRGAGLKHISKEYVQNIEIPFISKPEQHKLILILDSISNLIKKTNDKIKKLDELVKSQFIEMFGDPLDNPFNYPKMPLGDIAFITKLAGFEYTQYINYKDKGPITMVRGLNCKKGKLVLDDVYYENKETSDLLPRSKLNKGDIVLTYVGTIAECALIDEDNKYHLAPNVAKISILEKNKNIPEFFTSLFVCFRDYIVGFATATSQPKISMGEIRKIPFIVPPTNKQIEFADFVKQIDKSKFIVE